MSLIDNALSAVSSNLTSQLGQFSVTGADHKANLLIQSNIGEVLGRISLT